MTHATFDLVDMAYCALFGQSSWQQFVDLLARVADVESATLLFHDEQSNRGAVTLSAGMPETALREYASHYAARNPWMARINRAPVGRAITGEHLVPLDRFRNSEFYQDHLRHLDLETGVGVTIERAKGRFLLLSTLSGDLDEDRNLRRVGVLSGLAPHLQRISALYHRNRLEGLGASLSLHLGAGGVGLIVLDMIGRVVHANGEAEKLLARGVPAGIGHNGLLRFSVAHLQDRLPGLLRGTNCGPCSAVVEGLEITLLAVGRGSEASPFLGPSLAVLLSPRGGDMRLLAARYGLTQAETRVAAAIVDGQKPRMIAASTGVSIDTIRSQLKSIFSKTGATGQAHLVSIATGMAADRDARP